MRHVFGWLLSLTQSADDRQAILGDLDEEYRARVRPSRGWLRAQAWYAGEVLMAVMHGVRGSASPTPPGSSESASARGTAHPSNGPDGSSAGRPRRPRGRLYADLRFALRRWRRRPGFALAAILTLALGLGETTAMFSVADAVLLEPLPWPEADRLVAIHGVLPERRNNPATAPTWDRMPLTWQGWTNLQSTEAFEIVAGYHPDRRAIGAERDDIVETMYVSSAFLPLLGVQPTLGRAFAVEEDDVAEDVVLLSHEAWQRRFGGREDILGQSVELAYANWNGGP